MSGVITPQFRTHTTGVVANIFRIQRFAMGENGAGTHGSGMLNHAPPHNTQLNCFSKFFPNKNKYNNSTNKEI